MIVAVDFDGVVVEMRGRSYSDTETPLRLMPYAREGLRALKNAGHTLLLYSARANRSIREDLTLDPLIRSKTNRNIPVWWERSKELSEARYAQMLAFIESELPGVFDAIDDGVQGKPVADIFIDDRAVRFGPGPLAIEWRTIAQVYGEPVYDVSVQNNTIGGDNVSEG